MTMRQFLEVCGHGTRIIYLDNGTNFTGASAELKRGLKRLDDHKITNKLAPCGIEGKHTSPLASHQGGIYEAIIRLVHKTMASMVADRHLRTLTDEGLLTLFKETECILNNRPLTRVGTEHSDVEALTPSMLLTGSVCPGLPNDVFLTSDSMRLSWRACQFRADEFWRRWRAEYLPFYSVVNSGWHLSEISRLVILFCWLKRVPTAICGLKEWWKKSYQIVMTSCAA